MRILAVTNMHPTPEMPSYGIFVLRQIEALRSLGHEVEVVFINGSQSKAIYLEGFYRIAKAVRRFKPEVIHAHYGVTGFVTAYPKHRPLLISLCGDDVLGTPAEDGTLTLKSRVNRQLTRLACRRADRLIVKSPQMGEVVREWGMKAQVVPNGVDTDFFDSLPQSEAREQLGLNSGPKYILFPSTPYEKRKRVDLAEQVVRELNDFGVTSELLVVYHQPQEKLCLYYSACDLMLLTSEWEGSPNVLKEAMACNLPSVSFDVGDVRWLCEGTKRHRVVAKHDVGAMVREAKELLAENSRADGRVRILAELSGIAAARKVEALLTEAICSFSAS